MKKVKKPKPATGGGGGGTPKKSDGANKIPVEVFGGHKKGKGKPKK